MELNPRRGRKDEGRAGHGMGEDDGHAGREEQEGAAMERERCGPPPPSCPPRARRPRRVGRAGAARRPAQGGGGAARRPKQRGGGGGSRRAQPWREREVREGEARRKRAKGKIVFLSDLSVENE